MPVSINILFQGELAPLNRLQGYLAHKKQPPPRTLQEDNVEGPLVVLGGWVFLMSEVPLYPMPIPSVAMGVECDPSEILGRS